MCMKRRSVRLCVVLLIVMTMLGNGPAVMSNAGTTKAFPDVPAHAWYAGDLNYITSDTRRILEGSTDGRYYPESPLSVEQFIKCTIVAAGFRPTATGGHWAQPFIDKALALGIIRQGQFDTFSRGITRGEMAVVILSALTAITGEAKPGYDVVDIPRRMADYASFTADIRVPVCQAYHLGILTGLTDGKFHPERILTRSQATAVIRRVIDASARIKLLPYGTVEGEDMWSDAEFQQFMATEDWKKYLNPNPLQGMTNGKLMFYEFKDITEEEIAAGKPQKVPVLLQEPEYSMYYEIAKKLAYYAKKLGCTASVGYVPGWGGYADFDLSSLPPWEGYGSRLCFSLRIGAVSLFNSQVKNTNQEPYNGDIKYRWEIQSLYTEQDAREYEPAGSQKHSDWSIDKYVRALSSISTTIYGKENGEKFASFMVDKYDAIFWYYNNFSYSLNDDMSVIPAHVFASYPTADNKIVFYTAEVEE